MEVGGSVTNKNLDNLISQTEYSLAVTPIYDVGPGQPMMGEAITGRNGNFADYDDTMEHCSRDDTDLPFLCSVDVVPAPKNLQFSDVTQTSFRATWEHGAPDVALYRIGWSKKGENNFQYVSKNHLCMYSSMVPTETALALLSGQRRQREHGKCRPFNRLLRYKSCVLLLQQFSPSRALFVFLIRTS